MRKTMSKTDIRVVRKQKGETIKKARVLIGKKLLNKGNMHMAELSCCRFKLERKK